MIDALTGSLTAIPAQTSLLINQPIIVAGCLAWFAGALIIGYAYRYIIPIGYAMLYSLFTVIGTLLATDVMYAHADWASNLAMWLFAIVPAAFFAMLWYWYVYTPKQEYPSLREQVRLYRNDEPWYPKHRNRNTKRRRHESPTPNPQRPVERVDVSIEFGDTLIPNVSHGESGDTGDGNESTYETGE